MYSNYGGECYIVKAKTKKEAIIKLKKRESHLNKPIIKYLMLDSDFIKEISFVDDVMITPYVGE